MSICIKCGVDLPEDAIFCHLCGKKQTVTAKQGRKRGNGEGSVYKRGNTWEAAVVLGYKLVNGKAIPDRRTKGGFKTKKEAIAYLPELKQEKLRNVPTLNDLWLQYKGTKYTKLSKSRQEKYNIAWPKMEALKYCRIDMLVVADLQAVIDQKAATYYPARDIRDLFSILFQTAMPDKFVTVNLAEFLTLPDKQTKEREAFTAAEIQKLWEDYGAGNWWTGYILLMIYTGMMPGELMEARKEHIRWQSKMIQGAGKKTETRKTTPIVLADVIIPVLQNLCAHTEGEKLIAINKDNFYVRYYETLERAGCRKLTPYSCRHTAATSLALENIAPSVIQKIMRHAKFSTTEQYIHVNIDPLLEAVNKISSVRAEQAAKNSS